MRSFEVAVCRLSDEFFFSRLGFTPISGAKRHAESLTINKEVRVPSLTALYECHLVLLASYVWILWIPFVACATIPRAQSTIFALIRAECFRCNRSSNIFGLRVAR